jgi:hypothetical protein
MSVEKDFKLTIDFLRKFFSEHHIKKILNHVYSTKNWRFEKWLQIELSSFLSHQNEVGEFDLEKSVGIDRRKNTKRYVARVDVILRKRYTAKNLYIIWELKCAKMASTCIRHMFKDLRKIEETKSDNFLSSYWLVGVHCNEKSEKVLQNILKKSDEFKRELKKTHIHSEVIKGTNHSFTVF